MNLLTIGKSGSYSDKMAGVKLILMLLGGLLIIPSAFTNYEFFANFFNAESSSSSGICALVAIIVDVCKIISVVTFFNILFSSIGSEKGTLYFDLVSFLLSVILVFCSVFVFSKKGLEYSNSLSELEKSSFIEPNIEKANKGASTREKRKLAAANLSILEKTQEINEANREKEEDISKIKKGIIDNSFFFLLLCEGVALFCCVSLSYLSYRRKNESEESDSKNDEEIRKLKNKYSSAVYRGNDELAEKYKNQLLELGEEVPKRTKKGDS